MEPIPSIEEIFGVKPGRLQQPSAPPRSSDDVPFTPRVWESKICPRCRENKRLGPEFWYRKRVWRVVPHTDGEDNWSTRERVWVPSTYCRVCTNRMKAGQAKTRRHMAKLSPEERVAIQAELQGPCSVCGRRSNDRMVTRNLTPACPTCHRLLEISNYDPAVARSNWKALFVHCADEERIKAEVLARTDRVRVRAHQFNPDAKGIYYSHHICVEMENQWKAVMRFLT